LIYVDLGGPGAATEPVKTGLVARSEGRKVSNWLYRVGKCNKTSGRWF